MPVGLVHSEDASPLILDGLGWSKSARLIHCLACFCGSLRWHVSFSSAQSRIEWRGAGGCWTSHQSGEMRFCWAAVQQGCVLLLRPAMGMGCLRSLQDVRVQLSKGVCRTDDKPRTCWMDRCRLLTVAFQKWWFATKRRPPSVYKGALTSLPVVRLGCCVAPVRMLNCEWLGIATIACFFSASAARICRSLSATWCSLTRSTEGSSTSLFGLVCSCLVSSSCDGLFRRKEQKC
jgi:hypothetical protein